jgi:hypothetical protein
MFSSSFRAGIKIETFVVEVNEVAFGKYAKER